MTQADTLPKLLLAAATGPNARRVAIRHKKFGVWNTVTWAEYAALVRDTFFGLRALGLRHGDRVAMLAENVPEWLYVDLAVQTARGMVAGIFPDSLGPEIRYIIEHSGARFVVVGDQEQADKVLNLDIPALERVVVVDDRGMADYIDSRLMTFAQLLDLGRRMQSQGTDEFVRAVEAGKPEDPAVLLYTSGTTGKPKGVILSQHSVVWAGRAMRQVEGLGPSDQVISYLPFAWVGERMMSLYYALAAQYTVNFPEDLDIEVVLANWREVLPSFVLAPPRIWERLCSRVYIGIDNTTWLKRTVFNAFMPIGYRVAQARLSGQAPAWWLRMLMPVADLLLFRWLRNQLGLSQARSVFTGGAALGPEVFTFFHAIGINLRQVYGQTECAGIAVVHEPRGARADTVGKPLPGMEVRISETGEVLVRGPLVFSAYLNNPEAYAGAFQDGWLRTGDQGRLLPDGQLVIVDRLKDVSRTAHGDEFSPQLLENKLKFSRYIREAVVVGHGRPYVAALIQIDYENVGNWATRRGITYTTFKDLSQRPETAALIEQEVAAVNRTLPEGLRIRRFHLLDKELDADDDEITRTTKLRRSVIEQKYRVQIDGLYEDVTGSMAVGGRG